MSENTVWNGHKHVPAGPVAETPTPGDDENGDDENGDDETESEDVTETNPAAG